jgi:hypothetical protein
MLPVRYELDCKYCYKKPVLEGLAGDAWEPSKHKLLFLTPPHLVVSLTTFPKFCLSLSLIISQLTVSRLSRQCGILNISQPYRPPRPVMGIALL